MAHNYYVDIDPEDVNELIKSQEENLSNDDLLLKKLKYMSKFLMRRKSLFVPTSQGMWEPFQMIIKCSQLF